MNQSDEVAAVKRYLIWSCVCRKMGLIWTKSLRRAIAYHIAARRMPVRYFNIIIPQLVDSVKEKAINSRLKADMLRNTSRLTIPKHKSMILLIFKKM